MKSSSLLTTTLPSAARATRWFGLIETDFEHVLAIVAALPQVQRKCDRQLIVDQRLHADGRMM